MQQDKANLSRIRDNQRRSRARRKEYLQELEAKLRQCELQGIEASSQIQLVARRVADENKRLRELLAMNGIAVDGIESYARSSSGEGNDVHAGPEGRPTQTLERLLSTRRCCASVAPSTETERETGIGGHRHGNMSNEQPVRNSNERPGVEAPQLVGGPNSITNHKSLANHERTFSFPTTDIGQVQGTSDSSSQCPLSHKQPFSSSVAQAGNSLNRDDPTTANVNSCVSATDMIATMAGGDPATVREELGCVPGMDCQVENNLVFSIMDRYAGVNANS